MVVPPAVPSRLDQLQAAILIVMSIATPRWSFWATGITIGAGGIEVGGEAWLCPKHGWAGSRGR